MFGMCATYSYTTLHYTPSHPSIPNPNLFLLLLLLLLVISSCIVLFMVTCTRCCLHKAMRIVNMLTTLLAIALIIYSLWLLHKWNAGFAHLPLVHHPHPPRPWFMYTCLLMGIAICLTTLSGQMIPNCVSTSTLSIYIASIFSILILEVAAIVTVFYKIDWSAEITEYIDEKHQKFRSFVLSHLLLSRFILLFILIPQINVIVLAVVLWGIGTGPTTHRHSQISEMPHFTHSFLVGSISDLHSQTCSKCESFCGTNSHRLRFLSFTSTLFRMPFQRRVILR